MDIAVTTGTGNGNAAALPEARLAAFVAKLGRGEALPPSCRERLACALLDWFTAGLAGAAVPAASTLRALAQNLCGGTAAAPAFGGGLLAPSAAAFANAAISHLREIDDGHRGAMMHPGIVAIPPALALAAGCGASRARTAAAVVAGYEAALRTGEALGQGHYGIFHSTATAGALGAAAAAGVMLGLDAPHMAHAFGLAATQAAGLWQFNDDGAVAAKALHPAFAVRNGITAVAAAAAGFPGAAAWMTGRRGLYAALHGDGDLAALDRGLGDRFKVEDATTKTWPVCGQMFTALDAADALRIQERLSAADIAEVEVRIYPQALRVAGVDWPSAAAEVAFSPRFCLALLFCRGRLDPADTEAPPLDAADVRAFGERIRVVAEPAYAGAFPGHRIATVTLRLNGGRALSETRDIRHGDPEDPLSWDDLVARFPLYAPAVPESARRAVAAWCRGFAAADPQDGGAPPAGLFLCAPEADAAPDSSSSKE